MPGSGASSSAAATRSPADAGASGWCPCGPPQDVSPTDEIAAVADRELLDRAFAQLTTEHRAVVVLHHWEGLSLVEIADAIGIPVGTARSRLHYALRRLREALNVEMATSAEDTA